MATAVSEQIAVVVATRLGLISTGNGYETTASSVERPTVKGGFSPNDYQIVMTQGDITPDSELSHPGNPPATAWVMPIIIAGILRPSESDTTASDTLKNEFAADVIKSVGNATPWHTFGGLAINAAFGVVEDYQAPDGSGSGFKITLLVTFRTDETNLYNVRA